MIIIFRKCKSKAGLEFLMYNYFIFAKPPTNIITFKKHYIVNVLRYTEFDNYRFNVHFCYFTHTWIILIVFCEIDFTKKI